MRVAIYTRVSSDEQARDGVSLAMQEAACRELCARLYPDAVLRVYCDDGYSAETLLRPALQEMLDSLAEADVLVIWRQDRLLRHPRHLEGMMGMCATAGVRIVSTQGEVAWGNASERAFTRVRAVFSGLEVEQMSERISAALDHIAHEGRHPGGCLYGYRREGGALVVVADQAAIVREVYERYAAGESLAGIALSLTEREVPRRRGGTNWGNTAVDRMLANPTYCGRVPWKGDVARDESGSPVLGTHEPLVPVELWERVLRRIRPQSQHHTTSTSGAGPSVALRTAAVNRRQSASRSTPSGTLTVMRPNTLRSPDGTPGVPIVVGYHQRADHGASGNTSATTASMVPGTRWRLLSGLHCSRVRRASAKVHRVMALVSGGGGVASLRTP